MKRSDHEPERWSDRAGAAAGARQGAPVEDDLGGLFRRLRQATAVTTIDIPAAPTQAPHPLRATGRRGARLAWRLVLAAAVVVATGGAVSAARVLWRSMAAHKLRQQTLTVPAGSAVTMTDRSRRRLTVPGPARLELAGADAPVAPAVAAAASQSRGDSAAPPGETRRLAQAFHALRVDGDAAAALEALDRYAQHFPNGTLAPEARVARVEALLALGRTGDALPLLLAMRDRATGLTRDVQITRAELLAEKDRCAEAMPDFDDLVQADARDAVGERALYGRAACHLRGGRTPAARRDLDRYLSVYPGGRFAAAARRAADDLGTLPPSSP